MKRVVHITSVHTPFDSRILHRECKWLVKSGWEVFFVVPADFLEKKKDNVKILGIRKPGSRFKRFLTWLQIIKKIYILKPDLLHLHDPELLVILPVVRMVCGKKLKIVYDVHEYLVESIKDKFWIPLHLRNITAFFVSCVEPFLGKWVDGQVFVVKEQINWYLRWRTEKIVLHNYPDLDNFKTGFNKRKTADKRFTLVHIGSLYERRGIMVMLKAMLLLKKDGYDDVHLILGGAFESKAFKQQVNDFIHNNNLAASIDILGWVDYSRIGEQLARADAVWLAFFPCLQYSQISISTKQLEAMLASLPVVCSNIFSLTQFLHEADCGIAVEAKDPEAHAAAIKKLYKNPKQAKEMGSRGRNLVLGKYNWKNEFKKLENFYGKLI